MQLLAVQYLQKVLLHLLLQPAELVQPQLHAPPLMLSLLLLLKVLLLAEVPGATG
jgi:hypothetical protein